MTPAEELAALKAIQAALAEPIKRAEEKVKDLRQQTGAKSFDTPVGMVVMAKRKPTITYDEEGLIAWAEDNMPWELEQVTRVRPSLYKTLDARLRDEDGGEVVDTETGETVEWATVKPGTEYLTVKLTPEAKTAALTAVSGRLDMIASLATEGLILEDGRQSGTDLFGDS